MKEELNLTEIRWGATNYKKQYGLAEKEERKKNAFILFILHFNLNATPL